MILANQSIAQLNSRLQTVLGNAQTIISFRVPRADAEVLSRILGNVDPDQIKHNKQADIQHPLYSPLHEQWEGFIQHLTKQNVRQFTVKTAGDRLAPVWSEQIKIKKLSHIGMDSIILELLKNSGFSYHSLRKTSLSQEVISAHTKVFAY